MSDFKTVVVVDDEDAGRFVKTQTLKRAGYTVFEAATGRDGLELVHLHKPDVLLLDVNLPDISGLEVSRRLRAGDTNLPALQILQISSTAVAPADQVLGLQYGADVYLTEPVDSSVLLATVASLLRVRRAEAALATALDNERSARQVAEDANRAKDDFIATLSHELRTPLNALMGWIWQLRHSSLSETSRERALDSLERNARMQAQLINDLLDVSRISKGKLQLELRLVDLEDIAADACNATREIASLKHVDLETAFTSVVVIGDESRLLQIVTNLLTNALQYTSAGGRVRLTVDATGDEALLTVSDTGAGIDPALLPHIFDPFRQGEGVLSRRHGGLGLGLAVVRQLVDLHGGSIEVKSDGFGHGATFAIRMPREARVIPSGGGRTPLVLEGLRVRISADGGDTASLSAILLAAGATVEADNTSDVDLTVHGASGAITFRFSAAIDAPWHTVEANAPPALLVREIARVAQTRVS